MIAIEKLRIAREILLQSFRTYINEVFLSEEHFTLKIIFQKGEQLFIRYNDYQEYSYQFVFSSQIGDFLRYDNFDDRWNVKTRPHHLHGFDKVVVESKMNGDPHHDMPLLIKSVEKLLPKE